MIQKLRTLAADERGTSLIEMALATPMFAALLMGMVDLSRAYSEKLQLEQASQRAIEKVMNNQTTSTSYNTLKAEAASAAGIPETDVTIDYWLECNGARQSNYDTSCTSGQIQTRYLNVEVRKKFSPIFGTQYFPGANTDGTFTLKADAGIRTQ
ncbi:MAG TPA: TadE/TadG family type IV pilus assembly protein [Sphingomicrobium sp.]|nr:TadE/TadG family type IV pilus assembly protein [Sphingomicrobium sp.]